MVFAIPYAFRMGLLRNINTVNSKEKVKVYDVILNIINEQFELDTIHRV